MAKKSKIPTLRYIWLAIFVAAACIGFVLLRPVFLPVEHDRTSDWHAFYQKTFSSYFWIPVEARAVSATNTSFPIMGSSSRVVITLPNTKTPAEWVALIAEKSEIGKFRQSETWYDASHIVDGKKNKHPDTKTDQHFVRYLPHDQTYEAVWGWD